MDFNDDVRNENSSTGPDFTKENDYRPEDDRYENNNNVETKRGGKGVFKTIVSTVVAGVVGSAVTLTVLPYTGYMKNDVSNSQPVAAVSQVNTVSSKGTTANAVASGSIADTVSKVSKAIVGIENYQPQNNNNDPFGNGNGGFGGFGNSNGSDGSNGFNGSDGSSGSYGSGGSNGSNGSSDNSQPTDTGSGIIFQKNGDTAYVVTNNHVVEGGSKIEVSLYNGTKTQATVVGTDALTDLAVLKIPSKNVTDVAQFGNSSSLRPGDPVYAIGNPLGLDLSRTVTSGIVSAMNRTITEQTSSGTWNTNVIQTDAAINPGNSGGALINDQGLVMGINSAKISQTGVEGLGFAIPSNDAIPIINQLIQKGKVVRPYLGVSLQDLSQIPQMYWPNMPSNVNQGVMIMNVAPNSVAARSGLQSKDVIVSMNKTSIASSTDLREFLYTKVKIGDTVDFGVYRNGQLKHISVKLTATNANA